MTMKVGGGCQQCDAGSNWANTVDEGFLGYGWCVGRRSRWVVLRSSTLV